VSSGAIRNKEYASVAALTPVNVDFVPNSNNNPAFKLIDVTLNLGGAATTSENLTVKSITPGASNTITEYTFDPSTTSDTSIVLRFDKDFAGKRTRTRNAVQSA
jgi:hypothetical protein